MMKLPNFTQVSSINKNPVYKNLYEVNYIGDNEINKTVYETFSFKIDNDICICQIHDSYHIKIEFEKVKYIIASCFDKTGNVVKFMKIKVNLDKVSYELKCTATSLSEITVNFNIEKLETYTPEDDVNINSMIKEIIREIKLNDILNDINSEKE